MLKNFLMNYSQEFVYNYETSSIPIRAAAFCLITALLGYSYGSLKAEGKSKDNESSSKTPKLLLC